MFFPGKEGVREFSEKCVQDTGAEFLPSSWEIVTLLQSRRVQFFFHRLFITVETATVQLFVSQTGVCLSRMLQEEVRKDTKHIGYLSTFLINGIT